MISDDQRNAALSAARGVRQEMSKLRSRVANGEITLADVFADQDAASALNFIYVVKILESLPNVGKVLARRVMGDVGVPEKFRVGGLSAPQRQQLIERLCH